MSESSYFKKVDNAERKYEFTGARLKVFQEATARMEKAIDSLNENLDELEEMYKNSKSDEEKKKLQAEITRHREAVDINHEKLRDYFDTINVWEIELEKSAKQILEDFTPDKKYPI